MKTKLFSFFIAVFLFSFGATAQKNAKTAGAFPVITLIGSGNGGWTTTAETAMLTSDGITYTLVDKVLTDGDVKFREGGCWGLSGNDACPPGTVTNPYGWGPVSKSDTGWPSGANTAPVDAGPNIQCKAGSWTITFNRLAGSWAFVPGTPLPIIKVVGTAVSAPGGAELTTADGIIFTAKKVTLVPGNCQFSIDGDLVGALTFPTGDALGTDMIPVTTTGIDYDITFDYSLYKYTFKVATFPGISIVGNGTGVGGWPGELNNPGPIDVHQMTTTDGVTYTLNNLPIVPGELLFRTNNAWDVKYGDTPFPTGSGNGGNNIVVPAGNAGTYNVTLNATTKAYAFNKITYAIVGTGVGGWPGDPGNPGPIDTHQLSTVDGINYTLTGLVVVPGGAKFRINNAWAGGDWGGAEFPSGTKTGDNIPTVAGTYNLTVNVLTGAYDFGTALAVAKFDSASFSAYPNPTRSSWNIVSGNEDITSVQVFDVLGKAVYTKFGASKEVSVNATELAKGVYFAKVTTAKGEATLKLMKQ